IPTFKSGRTSVMIWGGFSSGQKMHLVFMPKNHQKATDFVEIVYDTELIQFLNKVLDYSILMEDGAPVHRSNAPKLWQQEHNLNKLNWPANSPDLNPIENVWAVLKDAVQHLR